MKRFTLFAVTALMAVTSSYAQQQAGAADIISEQPEGTVYDNMYADSHTYFRWGGIEGGSSVEGNNVATRATVVEGTDGAIYLLNPFPELETGTYLKIDKNADGTYTAHFPQPIYAYTTGGAEKLYYAAVGTVGKDEDGVVGMTPLDIDQIDFLWEDGALSQESDGDVFIVMNEGAGADAPWGGYAVTTIDYRQPGDLVELPAGTELEEFYMKAIDDYGSDISKMVKGAIVGNEVYLQPFSYMPESFIKGTIDGDRVTFATKQYLGYSEFWEKHLYSMTATASEEWDDDAWEWFWIFQLTDQVVFDYDADAKQLTSDEGASFIENGGDEGVAIASCIIPSAFINFVEVAATPADPVLPLYGYVPYDEDYENGMFRFYVPEEDTEGRFISPQKLYYNVFIDGEKFEFSAPNYALDEPMTEIPASFTNDEDIYPMDGGYKIIYFYFDDAIETFGVQSYYVGAGEVHYSHLVTRPISQYLAYREDDDYEADPIISDPVTVGVSPVSKAEVQSVVWYTMDGRMMAAPRHGLNIKSMRLADGTTKNITVFIK